MVLWLESILSLIWHEFKSIELQFIDKFTAFSHSIPKRKTLAFCDKKLWILSKLWHKLRNSNKLDNEYLISQPISGMIAKFRNNIKVFKNIQKLLFT